MIARNSSFTYKGKAVDVKHVARELGVRYVLEGSVRKGGNRVRITAQLIDAATGNHIWADRYDGDLTDVFALQVKLRKSRRRDRAKTPGGRGHPLTKSLARRSRRLGHGDPGNSLFWRLTKPETEAAIDVLRQATGRYPDYGPAHSILAFVLLISGYLGWSVLEPQLQEAATLPPERPNSMTVIRGRTSRSALRRSCGGRPTWRWRNFDARLNSTPTSPPPTAISVGRSRSTVNRVKRRDI